VQGTEKKAPVIASLFRKRRERKTRSMAGGEGNGLERRGRVDQSEQIATCEGKKRKKMAPFKMDRKRR